MQNVKQQLRRTGARILLCFSAFFLSVICGWLSNVVPTPAQSQATIDSQPVILVNDWQYRWGDFSIANAEAPPCRTAEIDYPRNCWQSFQFPERLWKPEGEEMLWLRVSLPEERWQSPALYLGAIPHLLEAYLGEQLIYSAVEADFPAFPFPIVPLDSDFADRTLSFRVDASQSSAIYVGLFDRVVVGTRSDSIRRFLLRGVEGALGGLFIVLGAIAGLFAFNRQEKKAYLYFGAFAILVGIYIVSRSEIAAFILEIPTILDYLHYLSLYLIPASVFLFFEQIFGARKGAIVRRLWQFHLIYGGIAFLALVTQTDDWISMLYLDQIIFLVSALTLLAVALRIAIAGDRDAKIFTSGFAILGLAAIHDILVYRFEPAYWYAKLHPWGMLLFILILGFLLEHRFTQARRLLQHYAEALEVKNADLQKMDRLKDEFLANTSHELKTPLNGIIGIAESLIDGVSGQLSTTTVFNLSLIVSEGRRLTQLVNDILDFSQLKHQNIVLKLKPVGVREITDVVLTLSEPMVRKQPIRLINQVTPEIPPVQADESRLQQILHNLVSNAIKFTDNGRVEVSAKVLDSPEGYLELTVTDTGIGIPEEKLELIFASFEQADGSIARKYGGVGLGLAVTKELVQLHGGDIRVESAVGVGSRFHVTLPIARGKVEREPQAEISRVRESLTLPVIPEEPLVKSDILVPPEGAFKILIVDDEPVNIQVLVNYLSLQNYAITQATNGMEALEIIQDGFKPDLVLLDVMMPKMTGYELCQKIREQFLANELPVVLLTVKNQVSDLVEGFSAGANDYLTKPISKNELLARIKTHLRLAKINAAYGRFVPHEFLKFLERESIIDVQLGDQVQKDMTVLFADIRSFTTLSEKMSPKENFDFLNAYLSQVSPVIRNHHGFIDKYIGDAVMALFPETAEDALEAAIDMQRQVTLFNQQRQERGEATIAIGIGLHTGTLMLGTVGESQRMESTVIADAVNLASRLEGLTKVYGVGILVSEQTLHGLDRQPTHCYRFLGRVHVKGKSQPVGIFEICDADSPESIALKMETRAEFEQAVALYIQKQFAEAQQLFERVLQRHDRDRVTQRYIERCKRASLFGVSELDIVIR
jgi:two-component system sensor histidine kinase ChiS